MSRKPTERYHWAWHRAVRMFCQRALLKAVIATEVRVTVEGERNVEGLQGPFLVVANHSSHLDAATMFTYLPYSLTRDLATATAGDYFYNNPVRSNLVGLFFNSYPVDRGVRKSKNSGLSVSLLRSGVPLLIYPEGTRSRNGTMAPFKPGAAALCISRHVPALPVALVGIRQAMPHGNVLPVPGRPEVHVVFGKPMWAEQGETAVKFAERIREQVATMHDQTALATGFPRIIDYQREALEAKSAAADDEAGDGTVEPEPDSRSDKES